MIDWLIDWLIDYTDKWNVDDDDDETEIRSAAVHDGNRLFAAMVHDLVSSLVWCKHCLSYMDC